MASTLVMASKESGVTAVAEETLQFDDDDLRAIAEVYKNEGNEEFRKKDYNNAIYFYTEGIKVNCKDKELNAMLYSNRAAAHFNWGKYTETLNDAELAIGLQPSLSKAFLHGARAYVRLNQLNEAIKWCDKGLAVSFIAVDNIYINMQKLL